MAKIMELFAATLDDYVADYEKEQWDVSFRGEEYPPRIVLEQAAPPLYRIGADGEKTLESQPTIQIIGRPEIQVVTSGKLQISKKDLNRMVNRATEVLNLYLHGFMQERKELEEQAE